MDILLAEGLHIRDMDFLLYFIPKFSFTIYKWNYNQGLTFLYLKN